MVGAVFYRGVQMFQFRILFDQDVVGFAGLIVIFVYFICRHFIPRLDISAWSQRIWLQVVARGVLALFVLALGARAFQRNFDWENDVTLWTQAVEACPNSFKTHKSLAYAIYEKDTEYRNIDRIIDEGEKAVKVTDKTQIVFLHLGAYYRIKGDLLAQHTADGSLVASAASLCSVFVSVSPTPTPDGTFALQWANQAGGGATGPTLEKGSWMRVNVIG